MSPPSGEPPPERTLLPDGRELELAPIARETTALFAARHPDQRETYGEALEAWTAHDLRHILAWTALDLRGLDDLDAQLSWLAGVLRARGYAVANVAESLELAAEVLQERRAPMHEALATRLRAAARRLVQ